MSLEQIIGFFLLLKFSLKYSLKSVAFPACLNVQIQVVKSKIMSFIGLGGQDRKGLQTHLLQQCVHFMLFFIIFPKHFLPSCLDFSPQILETDFI